MSEDNEKVNQETQPDDDHFVHSVNMAFNLGVSANQNAGHTKSVVEIAGELGQQIFENFSKGYGDKVDENFLRANTEYFLQISLMGFIVPSICAFDPSFKDTLLNLIFKKAKQDQEKAQKGPSSTIIT